MNQTATFLEIKQWLAKAKMGDPPVDWSLMEPYWKWIEEQLENGTDLQYLQALASLQSEFKNLVPPVSVFSQKAAEKIRQCRLQENGDQAH